MVKKLLQAFVALIYFSGALALESTVTALVLVIVGVFGTYLLAK